MVQKCFQCNWLQEQRLCYSHDSNIVHSIEQWIVPPSCNGSTDLALRFIQQCISRTSGSKCCVPSTLLDRGNQPCGTLIQNITTRSESYLQSARWIVFESWTWQKSIIESFQGSSASSTVSRLVQSWNSTRFCAHYILSWIRLKNPNFRISTCLRIFQTINSYNLAT